MVRAAYVRSSSREYARPARLRTACCHRAATSRRQDCENLRRLSPGELSSRRRSIVPSSRKPPPPPKGRAGSHLFHDFRWRFAILFRIESVAQRVTEEVEAEHGGSNRHSGKN